MSHAHQPKAQVTAVPYVDAAACRVCRRCLARDVCRSKALLRIDRDEPPFVDAGRCYGCRACLPACPHGAIRTQGS
jgi:MinD superfamily P-loop ATPase